MSSNRNRIANFISPYNISDILQRIKDFYDFRNDTELARFLEVPTSTLSTWKSRNTFPYDTIFAKCVNIDLDYLVFGREKIDLKNSNKQLISGNLAQNETLDNMRSTSDIMPLRPSLHFSKSAKEMIENYVLFGEKLDWEQLPASHREKLNLKFEQCRIAADQAYRTYTHEMEQINNVFFSYFLKLTAGEITSSDGDSTL